MLNCQARKLGEVQRQITPVLSIQLQCSTSALLCRAKIGTAYIITIIVYADPHDHIENNRSI